MVLFLGMVAGYVIPCLLNAGVESLEELSQHITTNLEGVDTVYVTFEQTRKISGIDYPMEAHGFIIVQKPDRVRFEFTEPFKSILIFAQGQHARYEWQSAWKKSEIEGSRGLNIMLSTMLEWFMGNFHANNNLFEVQLVSSAGNYVVRMDTRPDKMRRIIDHIAMTVDRETYTIQSVTLLEADGDSSTFRFTRELRNPVLPDDVFSTMEQRPVIVDTATLSSSTSTE